LGLALTRWLLALIIANLIGLLALVFIFPHLMVSPGALIDGHTQFATDCFACHAPLRGASSQRCVTCHAVPDIGFRTTKGAPIAQKSRKTPFHQELIEHDCMACHSDHQAPRLTQRSRKPFSHALLRASVRDHCESCHKVPTDSLHRQITGNCLQCHRQEQWKPASFEHDKLFLLDRDHNTTCVTCHADSDYSRYTCYGCHEHQPDKIRRKHEKEGIRNFENCVECHRSAEEKPRERGSREGRRRD
jgi:Class III cytochrome C family